MSFFSSGAAEFDKMLQRKPASVTPPPSKPAAPSGGLTQSGGRLPFTKFVLNKASVTVPPPPPPPPAPAPAPQILTKRAPSTPPQKKKKKKKSQRPKKKKELSSDDGENEGDLSFVSQDSPRSMYTFAPTYHTTKKTSKYIDDHADVSDDDDDDDEEGYNSDPDRFKNKTFNYGKKELVAIPLEYVDPEDLIEVEENGKKKLVEKEHDDPNDTDFDLRKKRDPDDEGSSSSSEAGDPMDVVESDEDDEEEDEEEEEDSMDPVRRAKLRKEINRLKPSQVSMFAMDAHKPRHVRASRVSQTAFEHVRSYIPPELVEVVKKKGDDEDDDAVEASSSSSVLNPNVDEEADTTNGRSGDDDDDDDDETEARRVFVKNVVATMRKRLTLAVPDAPAESFIQFNPIEQHVGAMFGLSLVLFNAAVEQQKAKNLQNEVNQGTALRVGNPASHKQTELAQEHLSFLAALSETETMLELVRRANNDSEQPQ